MKLRIVMGFVVAIICVAGVLVVRRDSAQQAASHKARGALEETMSPEPPGTVPAVGPVVEPAAPEPLAPEPVAPPPTPTVKAGSRRNTAAQARTPAAPPDQYPNLNNPVFKEQLGRAALSFVGDDPDADEVWIQVINDPSLSADVRQNLIEDLNEDGLSDPQSPTVDDLPLILNRLQLIEDLAPDAMDQVNYDAFLEAYKDLVTMAARLML